MEKETSRECDEKRASEKEGKERASESERGGREGGRQIESRREG